MKLVVCSLQKALKEKEEHIEQLLRERDLERSDVARASVQVDEVRKRARNETAEFFQLFFSKFFCCER